MFDILKNTNVRKYKILDLIYYYLNLKKKKIKKN